MEEIIKELLQKGIEIAGVYLKNGELAVVLSGFYKSGTATLFRQDNKVVAATRYNEVTEISDFEDLVQLNYRWWQYSKDRYEGWSAPDSAWLPHLIELGLVKEKTQIYYE